MARRTIRRAGNHLLWFCRGAAITGSFAADGRSDRSNGSMFERSAPGVYTAEGGDTARVAAALGVRLACRNPQNMTATPSARATEKSGTM